MQMTTAPDKQAVTRWGIVGAAMFAGIVAAGYVGKLPPALPSIRAEFGFSLVTAGWLASLFSVTGMLTGIFLGALADRLNHWRLAIGGLALMGVSGFYGSLSTAAPELFFSRFSEGIGFLGVVVAAPAIIARATRGRDRNSALGLWPAYMPGGISLMILAAPLALQATGWRGLWVAVAALAMFGAVAMWAFGGGARSSGAASGGPPMWQNLRSSAARSGPWLVGGCFALYGAQLYAIVTWMPTFMIEQRGVGAATAATLTALVVVANGACSVFGGWLLHKGAVPWAMMAASGAVMAVCAYAAFSIWIPDLTRYVSSLILCGAGGVVASATFAVAPGFAATPAQLGIVNGILVQASNLAQFVGPTAIAALAAKFGRWESALWTMVGANALLIVFALFVHRQEKTLPA